MTVPLPTPGDSDWTDWAQMVHDRVAEEGAANEATVRSLGTGNAASLIYGLLMP